MIGYCLKCRKKTEMMNPKRKHSKRVDKLCKVFVQYVKLKK